MLYLSVLWAGFLGILVLQLWLCLSMVKGKWKLLPALLLACGMGICIGVYEVASGMGPAGRELAFLFDQHSVLPAFWLVGDLVAWTVYFLIKFAQKIRNKFVMCWKNT